MESQGVAVGYFISRFQREVIYRFLVSLTPLLTRMIRSFDKRSFEESISQDRLHERSFVLGEAFCFFVVACLRNAVRIIGNVTSILFVCFVGGKAEKRNRDI